MRLNVILGLFLVFAAAGFVFLNSDAFAIEGTLESKGADLQQEKPKNSADYPVATFAGGCFWCVESEFRAIDGIVFTRVGYIGGDVKNPTYRDITTGRSGHAEAVEVLFDSKKVTYEELVTFFLTKAHDPTQLDRQGVDVGPQYRSEIFYHNDAQRDIAQKLIKKLKSDGVNVVTKLSYAPYFWEAELEHQQYYEKFEAREGQVHPRVFFKKKLKLLKGQ